jgi:hypothetical protein
MLSNKFSRYYHTIKDLKFQQVFYRAYYAVAKKRSVKFSINSVETRHAASLTIQNSIAAKNLYSENNTFSFLNLTHHFEHKIDWNFKNHGMLWAYNLNYFEFLTQENIPKNEGLRLINDYICQSKIENLKSKIGLDSYPISLRNIFWIRFITKHNIQDDQINSFLYENYTILLKKLEYHLLGNHLLENAFSLLFGAYYFRNEKLYKKAKKLLIRELNEQILQDGAHFELSPMYHQIMLYRLLDCINLVSNNAWKNRELLDFFFEKASKMLLWLNAVTFDNGDIPLVNDAAFEIAPTTKQLNDYAKQLSVKVDTPIVLKESGYRKFKSEKFELFVDVGNITPKYQPGHSHADTFNFVLYSNNQPAIIDTGTSTYEVNEIRFYERSTAAHNTVKILQKNSSHVWGGHRTAQKANVKIIKETPTSVQATHDGYRRFGENHTRTFEFSDVSIKISDEVTSNGVAYFHFHPDENINKIDDNLFRGNNIEIKFVGANRIDWVTTHYASEFNKPIKTKSLRVFFTKHLKTLIQ